MCFLLKISSAGQNNLNTFTVGENVIQYKSSEFLYDLVKPILSIEVIIEKVLSSRSFFSIWPISHVSGEEDWQLRQ